MSGSEDELLRPVRDYYSTKIATHGPVPAGVDWGSLDRQERRFAALSHCLAGAQDFSLLDVGCGYGALLDYLQASGRTFTYCGVDISAQMIAEARRLHPASDEKAFREGRIPDQTFDYVVASGIFNVMGGAELHTWRVHVRRTLAAMYAQCRIACTCNFLTCYSDADKKQAGLFYADPGEMLDFCIRELSPDVDLLHHYGAWDFTVHVFRRR